MALRLIMDYLLAYVILQIMDEMGCAPELVLCPLSPVHQGHYICRVNYGDNFIFSQWAQVRIIHSAGNITLLLVVFLLVSFLLMVCDVFNKCCHLRLQQQQSVSRVGEWAVYYPSTSVPSAVWRWQFVPGVQCGGQPSCTVWVVPQHGTHETTQDALAQGGWIDSCDHRVPTNRSDESNKRDNRHNAETFPSKHSWQQILTFSLCISVLCVINSVYSCVSCRSTVWLQHTGGCLNARSSICTMWHGQTPPE